MPLLMLSFASLAQCFEQLEHTSSRKQLTTLLADLLRLVDADEIAEVSYLLDFIRSSQRGVILRRSARRAEDVVSDD